MAILVDRRIGSRELLRPLRDAGLECELETLEYGDVAFCGRGEAGADVQIGVELKTLGDLVQSLRSGRLAGHQLPGLQASYDHVWLIVEGDWRANRAGRIASYGGRFRGWETHASKMTVDEMEKHLLTLDMLGGLHVRFSRSRDTTVRAMASLYRWWTDRDLDQHRSHITVHTPSSFYKISDFRAAVMRWPGIGLRTSKAVEEYFNGSIWQAANATEEEWAELRTKDGAGKERKLGTAVAKKICAFLRPKETL